MNEDRKEVFKIIALNSGSPEAAKDLLVSSGMMDPASAEDAYDSYVAQVEAIGTGGPVIRSNEHQNWYPGPTRSGATWNHFVETMKQQGKEFLLENLSNESNQIVNLTPNPTQSAYQSKGLVVGNVQSGKTNNFIAVAAKLADQNYRLVIVLTGIHNSLRNQTHQRLDKYLVNDATWFSVTNDTVDFNLAPNGELPLQQFLPSKDKTVLIVVKKNGTVLKKLKKWLSNKNAQPALQNSWALVIDDEADQASAQTNAINPLICDILGLLPRHTYIGYTATPFANVFIDPTATEDLYPRDFIYALPKGDGYFGSEELFGLDSLDSEIESSTGYDMIRRVSDSEDLMLRPTSKESVSSFDPKITKSLRLAIRWFFIATAARRFRGDKDHSSMLIHTSFKTEIQDRYLLPIKQEVQELNRSLLSNDAETLKELKKQWEDEQKRVEPTQWGFTEIAFSDLLPLILSTIHSTKVIVDNYKSDERLNYDVEETINVIAIGGNTLSRGITLQGLVSSFFLRPSKTYDTLLQMGRWFGYRIGYQDLPRIWTTLDLENSFRHLALVEKELRTEIETYRILKKTPLDIAVRIRTHNKLRITAKMGAAQPKFVSFAGSQLETRFFKPKDGEWLQRNLHATAELIVKANSERHSEVLPNGSKIWRNIPVSYVLQFIQDYQFTQSQRDIDTNLVSSYIQNQLESDPPRLQKWNLVVRSGSGPEVSIPGLDLTVKSSNRSPLKLEDSEGNTFTPIDADSEVDIGSLIPSRDVAIDLTDTDKTKMTAAELKASRAQEGKLCNVGLIIIYLLDAQSAPSGRAIGTRMEMNAINTPVGFSLVFPELPADAVDSGAVQTTFMAVDLPNNYEEIDVEDEMWGGE